MRQLFSMIGKLLSPILGNISWSAPPWIVVIKTYPLRFAASLLLIISATIGYQFYKQLPKPVQYMAVASAPGVTQVTDDKLYPDSLRIDFRYDREYMVEVPENLGAVSVANLDLMGKELTQGIRIEPAIAGSWRWQSDHVLVFEPENDWPAAQEYNVSFTRELFKEGIRLSDNDVSFTTPQFNTSLESIEFYQDPLDRKIRRVVATIDFTHAVDPASLEKQLTIGMRPSGADIDVAPVKYDFTVNYDKQHRKAYVQTVPIALPEKSNYMKLMLTKGVKSALGSATTENEVTGEVRIPDIYSFFRIKNAECTIVRDQEDKPEQIVGVEFTDDVAEKTVLDAFELYLLPKRENNRNWRGPREINKEILSRSEKIKWHAVPNERNAEKRYNFRIDTPTNRQLYLKINGGLESISNFKMASDYDAVLRVAEYPRELKITNEGSLLAMSGDHKLGILSRNLEAVRVHMGMVLPQHIQHLVSQTYGDITNPKFSNYNFNEQNMAASVTRVIQLNKLHPKEANYAAVDLDKFRDEKLKYGIFFITIEGWDEKNKRRIYGTEDKRLIMVTDLGLIVKDNADSTHDVYVQSIHDGKPVDGAKVSLLGKNGLPVMARTTVNGHAKFDATKSLSAEWTPTVYVVSRGKDIAFLPFNRPSRQLNLSRFDIGGQHKGGATEKVLSAFLFSDRGIYRPGDTANLSAIVRYQDISTAPAIPVEMVIRNPRGSVTLKKRLTLPELGFFDLDYTTDATAETGYYDAELHLIRDNKYRGRQIGSVRFQVEEFQPDRLKINSRIFGAKDKGWISADRLKAEVQLKNLFGTPAQDRNVTAQMSLTPTGFRFREYSDYRFDDPLADSKATPQSVSRALESVHTDADGIARFELPLSEYIQGTYRLTLNVQGFEEGGGRSVSASSSVLLSPLETLVGFKADGRLGYIHKDGERKISFIAIDRQVEPTELKNLRLRRIEKQNVSTLVRQTNGTYKYQTVVKEKQIDEKPYAIAKGGSEYALPTDRAGSFTLEVFDEKDQRLAQISYTVVGKGNLDGALEKNAELALKLNKNDFFPGETIEMNITAPYTGTGIITIESDKVHSWKWFHTTTTSTMQTISVPKKLEGNAYVNVAFIRAADSHEIYVSPLSYAVAPFTIDRSKRQVNVELEVPEIARPGKPMKIDYTASRPSRIVVFAVDEGVLQVANYQTPKPLNHFLRKRALEVKTQQMVDLILPEFALIQERSASGGGMAEAAMAKALGRNLNPFARKVDKAVVYWSGIVEAGPDKRSVTYNVPETFSGQLRVMAVAVSDEAMGWAQQQTLVRGPFVISPNALTVAAPGDEFVVTVGLANLVEGSGDKAAIMLTAEASEHLELVGENRATLPIAEGGEGKTDFRFRAKDRPGAASIVFTAKMGNEDSRITATLSVRPASPYMSTFDSGYENDGQVDVNLPRRLYPELAKQDASASASPLVLVDGLNNYLENFPHGCTEQVVSQVFPLIGLMKHPGYADQAEQTHKKVEALIAKLRPRQLPDGGFSLWPGGRSVADFPSAYVMQFLTEAKDLGYAVPGDIYSRGLGYLRSVAARGANDLESARVRALAIYLLTSNGEVTTNDLVNLQEWLHKQHKESWEEDLVSVYMAATYRLLKKEGEAKSLVSGYRIGGKKPERYSDFHSPLTLDAQYLYILAKHFPDRLKALEGKGVRELVEPVFGGHYNTIGSAYTILALGAYSKAILGTVADEQIEISELLKEGAKKALKVKRRPFVSATPSVEAKAVAIQGDNPIFYQVSQTGFDLGTPEKAITEGLEIQRDYLDEEGNEVTTLEQGKEVTVRLRIRSVDNDRVNNVAVIDLLPGGFEVIRSSVPRKSSYWSADYVDIREDRVVFYGSFGSSVTELRYRAKLTAAGSFVVPPAYAEAMYNRSVHGRSIGDTFRVNDTK